MLEQKQVQDGRESFRQSLEDLVVLVKRLAPFCSSVEHLTSIASLALENDAQLEFLINLMSNQAPKR